MKRVVNLKLKFFFSLLLLCYSDIFANNLLESKSLLKEEQVREFFNVLTNVCESKNFLSNVENHKSYPEYGLVKDWKQVCQKLKKLNKEDNFIEFLIKNFRVKQTNKTIGLLTGYYEPTINVSHNNDQIFRFPILKKNKYYLGRSRQYIKNNFELKDVLLWTDDIVDLFFLHIQGSGIGKFNDGTTIKIAYDGNNNLPYSSIGKHLINKGYLKPEETNLFSIKDWLRRNKKLSIGVMNSNKRYIFFKSFKSKNHHPVGAFGIQLSPETSIAVDKKIYPLGLPFIILSEAEKMYLPVVSLDTGSAIIGPNRADIFTGREDKAEEKAGKLKKKIYLLALIPYSN